MPACVRDPDVETELRCGRCEAYICPRCLVFTPVGTRCPDCARLRRPPMYELGVGHLLRAYAVSLVVGGVLGVVGGFVMPAGAGRGGMLLLLLSLFAGIGAGAALAAGIDRATGGKRGVPVQLAAVAGVLVAATIRLVLAGDLALAGSDVVGAVAVLTAVASSWQRLT